MWPPDYCTVQILARLRVQTPFTHSCLSPSPSKLFVLSEGTVGWLSSVKANSGIAPVILHVGMRWKKMVSFMHWPLYPQYPLKCCAAGATPELVPMFCREGKSHASPSNHNQDCPEHSSVTALTVIWYSQLVQ